MVLLALDIMFQFFISDILGNSVKLLGFSISYLFILLPLAIFGLVFEYLRKCKHRVRFKFKYVFQLKKQEFNPFKKSKSR